MLRCTGSRDYPGPVKLRSRASWRNACGSVANPSCCDGDALRTVLGGKHGYDYAARFELAMIYVRLCRLLCEQGHTVVCATVSMFEEVRQWARSNAASRKNSRGKAANEVERWI